MTILTLFSNVRYLLSVNEKSSFINSFSRLSSSNPQRGSCSTTLLNGIRLSSLPLYLKTSSSNKGALTKNKSYLSSFLVSAVIVLAPLNFNFLIKKYLKIDIESNILLILSNP